MVQDFIQRGRPWNAGADAAAVSNIGRSKARLPTGQKGNSVDCSDSVS